MYESKPPDLLLNVLGLIPTDIKDQDIEVFEDNWNTFLVFDSMATQWRIGNAGPSGLDYNVIPLCLESLEIDRTELKEILPGVRVMESEALSVMAEERERSAKKTK